MQDLPTKDGIREFFRATRKNQQFIRFPTTNDLQHDRDCSS